MRFRRSPLMIAIILLTLLPIVIGVAMEFTFSDIHAISITRRVLRSVEIDQLRTDGFIYKTQALTKIDDGPLTVLSDEMVSNCHTVRDAPWTYRSRKFSDLVSIIHEYCKVIEERKALVEEFRQADHRLDETVAGFGVMAVQAAWKTPTALDDVEAVNLDRLVRAYAIDPDAELKIEIYRRLGALDPNIFRTVQRQGEQALKYTDERQRLEGLLSNEHSYDITNKVKAMYVAAIEGEEERSSKARSVFLLLSACFGLFSILLIHRVQRAGTNLAKLNETLEDNVEQRTEELQRALDKLTYQQGALAQSAKMSALGEMAGGIAHEINTPLAAISLTAELLAAEATEQENTAFVEGLSTITTIVERIAKIVNGLKRFSRSDADLAYTVVPFSQILDDTLLLCGEKLKARGIKLEVLRRDNDALLNCSAEQISQVLINLMNNAVDAVEVSAQSGSSVSPIQRWIRIETENIAGQFTLRISDGGPRTLESA